MSHPLRLSLRIDWSELDAYGHVNNVMIMKYMQAARVHYWEELGLQALFAALRSCQPPGWCE